MRTRGLRLEVDARTLVAELDWEILPGQCWYVIGRNGAGKSTLLMTLAGILEPDAGSVQLKGRSLADWPALELARERAFLSQGHSDAFGYRVIEAVLTARHPYQASSYWESDADYQAAIGGLIAMDARHLAERDIRTLSGGERQRVAIAAILAQDTPLLLLDEPANALDLAHQMSVMSLLERLCQDSGKAVVMVSHDINLAQRYASHALLLMEGGRWHAGPVSEVMCAPLLSECLGHPIQAVKHGKRTIYLPVEDAGDEC
jgi:iron complex transport system ATP-binding protein